MRRRLVTSTTLIALAGVLVLGIPLGVVGGKLVRTDAVARLEREADGVGAALEQELEAARPVPPARLDALARPGHEILVVDRRGHRARGGTPLRGEVTQTTVPAPGGARVTVRQPASDVGEKVGGTWLLIALLSVGGVAAAVALAVLQARRLARPLEQLARASDRLGSGDFGVRPHGHGVPEVEHVAAALSRSAARIGQLVAREREFTANVTHQLRTPLTALRLRLEELERPEAPLEVRVEAHAALEQVDRLERTVDGLLAHARRDRSDDGRPLRLADVVRRLARTWGPLFEAEGRRLGIATGGEVVARADRATVEQALEVLLDNALRHGAGAARVAIARHGPAAVVIVEDQGPGIAAGHEELVFARRVSTAGGSGIGLALARDLVESAGGRLALVRPRPPRFELVLPRG